MKNRKNLSIFIFAVVLLIAQACGTKSEKISEESTADSTTVEASEAAETSAEQQKTELTVAEKRAEVAKETEARQERRRIALEERAKLTPTYTDADGNIVYNKAEVDPSFEGGKNALMKYLRSNIKFPKAAEEKGIEGTVFVDFIVGANGVVREVGVTDAPGEEVDQSFRDEAIRVVSTMPKWVPGRQHGKAVQVKYSLPISFQMI